MLVLKQGSQFTSHLLMTFLVIGFICLSSTPGYADGCSAANFKGARDFTVGQYPYALAAGDFNSDGKADIAAADYNGNSVRIAFGDGAGGFALVSTYASGMRPLAIAVGDLTGDTKPDLVVSNFDSNDISVLLNDGVGNFAITNYAAGVGPGEIALADLNDDNKPDVAVTNQTGGAIVVLLNNGTGGLLPLSFTALPPTSNPKDIVAADFNGDGMADLATANAVGTFSVVLRSGPNVFSSPVTNTVPSVSDLQAIAVGDFTGDSKLDLVVVSYAQSVVRLLQGNGMGGFMFNPPVSFALDGNSVNVYLRDVNLDNKLDIVAPIYTNSLGNSMVRVFYGDGMGGSSQMSDVLVGRTLRSVAITDLNGDSKPDVVTNFASLLKAGLSVSLNDGGGQFESATLVGNSGGSASVTSDFNVDGRPDLAWLGSSGVLVRLGLANGDLGTVSTYASASFAGHLTVGDFNQDGKPDIATANGVANSISVLLNNGSGGFGAPANYSVGSSAKALVTGDFNNDGKLDLTVAGNSLGAVRVFTGDGMGNFLLTGTAPVNASPASIVSGDFNNDNNLDVITANDCVGGSCTAKLITFFPGNGAGGFGAAVDISTEAPPASSSFPRIRTNFLASADFNGDGRIDLTWGKANPSTVFSSLQVAINTGGGSFATPITLADSVDNTVVATGDVNNDGRPDIVGASDYGGQLQVYLNSGGSTFDPPVNYSGVATPTAVTVGDINNDGKRDVIFAQTGGIWRLLSKCALSRGAHTPDFDGDGITDISVFRPSNGTWYLLYSSNGSFRAIQFGIMGDVPVPGDYDGDGRTDIAVFRPSSGAWYYLRSSDGAFQFQQFGSNGDIPVPGDYDGNGITNFAVWRPSTGYWYTNLNPATNFGAVLWGATTDKPVPADYDGDGKTDIAVFRPSTAYWYLLRSAMGYQEQQFGIAMDTPAPSDYNGDGKANFGLFRQSTGFWYTSLNPATNFGGVFLGQNGDIPVPGYYDGDGKADVAVFRNGDWYIFQSNTGSVAGTHFGAIGDEATPSAIHHP